MRGSRHQHFEAKRQRILSVAVDLTLKKGFALMSVQDLIDELDISKGAFFHYFQSKADLLEAMIGQMLDDGIRRVSAVVEDPGLQAIERVNRFFATLVGWKTGEKSFFLSVVRTWYGNENAVVRQTLREKTIEHMGRLVASMIRIGIHDQTFHVHDSDQAGAIVVSLLENMTDSLSKQLLVAEGDYKVRSQVAACVEAHTAAIERILGVPAGSFHIMDTPQIEQWFASPKDVEGGIG